MHKTNDNTIKVWDPLIRLFHWSLVLFFFIAYLTEDEWLTLHSYAGYSVGFLIAFRLLWGFIGTQHARFANFVTRPRTSIRYLIQELQGKAKHYLGHNPAGAAMIVALLISLSITTFTGMSLLATQGSGPLAQTFIASSSAEMQEEIHEFFANFTLLLVIIHIAGVALGSLVHKENLVRAMLTGNKTTRSREHHDIT